MPNSKKIPFANYFWDILLANLVCGIKIYTFFDFFFILKFVNAYI